MANDYSTIEIHGDSDPLGKEIDKAEGFFQKLGQKFESITASVNNALNIDGIIAKVKKGIAAFEETGEALLQMRFRLKSTGEAAGFSAKQLAEMGVELQKITAYGEDAIIAAQNALLKFTNVRSIGGIFQDAIKGAADLAAATGGSLVGATTDLGAALQSPIEGLKSLKEQGVNFTKQQERLIELFTRSGHVVAAQRILLQGLADTYGGAGAEKANTFSARWAKLTEYFDKTWKIIGGHLVPWLNKMIDVIEKVNRVLDYGILQIVEYFKALSPSGGFDFQPIIDGFMKMLDVGVQVFTLLQTVLQDWRGSFQAAWLIVESTAKSAFAAILDAGLDFSQGFVDAFAPMINFAVDGFNHIAKVGIWLVNSIADAWAVLYKRLGFVLKMMFDGFLDFFAMLVHVMNGNVAKFTWKGLEDSFKASLAKFPAFVKESNVGKLDVRAAAGLDDLIAGLKKDADELKKASAEFLDPFSDKFNKNLDENRKKFDDFLKKIKDIANGDPYASVDGADSGKKFAMDSDAGKAASDGFKSSMENLESLNKRITTAAANNPELNEMKMQTSLSRQQLIALQTMAKNLTGVNQKQQAQPQNVPPGSQYA